MIPALIIDGRCLYDRAWHASRTSDELHDYPSHVVAAGAAVASLGALLGPGGRLPVEPTHLLVCWDGTEAKTNKPRPAKDPAHTTDLAYFKALLPNLVGGSFYQPVDGTFGESDDAVATAIDLYKDKYDFTVLSSDKDLTQLAREARYFHLQLQQEVTEEDVMVKWHVGRASHLALYLALVGDPTDGVDGTDKIGRKKAYQLLEGMGDIPISDAVDLLVPQLNLTQREQMFASLELTLLRRDLPDVPEPGPIDIAGFNYLDDAGIIGTARNVWGKLLARISSKAVIGPDWLPSEEYR